MFDLMVFMGLSCIVQEHPNGSRADPWPVELPRGSKNAPAFQFNRKKPETGTRKLDHVFASSELAESLAMLAFNAPVE